MDWVILAVYMFEFIIGLTYWVVLILVSFLLILHIPYIFFHFPLKWTFKKIDPPYNKSSRGPSYWKKRSKEL